MEANRVQEEKILAATIRCINEFGLAGTTIRRIAGFADVNSAAISYYFRSKDILVEKAMEITLQNAFDWENIPRKENETVRERAVSVFLTLLEGLNRFPGIAKAHFIEALISGNAKSSVVIRLNEFLEALFMELKSMEPSLEDGMLKQTLMQITSAALIQPALLPNLFDPFYPSAFDTEENRRIFIENLVAKFL